MKAGGPPSIVLASTSRYRAELLRRIVPLFAQVDPGVDEHALPGEAPAQTAQRLAEAKARAVATGYPDALVIGSDQVADLDGSSLGKPGDASGACLQLAASSGLSLLFHTAVCVLDTRPVHAVLHAEVDVTRVTFRHLAPDEIARYVERDEPFDCAGSFRIEALGAALFERVESADPTALVGLPLISLCRLLRAAGVSVF